MRQGWYHIKKQKLLNAVVICIWLISSLHGYGICATFTVPGDALTIQGGINLASDNDTVLVSSGTYSGLHNEAIRFWGKQIVVRSESGAEVTGILVTDTVRAFIFDNGEDSLGILDGFTISGGYTTVDDWLSPFRGGILIDGASPVIRNCTIKDSYFESGGGIEIVSGSPRFENCTIANNQAIIKGGGIATNGEQVRLEACSITGNRVYGPIAHWLAYGGGISNSGKISFSNCRISHNRVDHVSFVPASNDYALAQAGGIYSLGGNLVIDGSVISHNSSGVCGAVLTGLGLVSVNNTIIFNNTANVYAGVVFLTPDDMIIGELNVDRCTFACNYSAQISSDGLTLVNNPTGASQSSDFIYQAATGLQEGTTTVSNSIFAFSGSTPLFSSYTGTNLAILHTNIWSTLSGPDYGGMLDDQTGLNGNISVDPYFCVVVDSGLYLDSLSECTETADDGGYIGARDAGCQQVAVMGSSLLDMHLSSSATAEMNQVIVDSLLALVSPWDTVSITADGPQAGIQYLQNDIPLYINGPGSNVLTLTTNDYLSKRAVLYLRNFCELEGMTVEAYNNTSPLLGYNAVNCADFPAVISDCELVAFGQDVSLANFDATPVIRNCEILNSLTVFGAYDIVASYNYWNCIDNQCVEDQIVYDTVLFTGRVRFSPILSDIPTDASDNNDLPLPTYLSVDQNYPNPFNPTTTICFCMRRGDMITIDIFSILGQHVRRLLHKRLPAGEHTIVWEGRLSNGDKVSSGVYFYRVRTSTESLVKSMMLLK